MQFPQAAGWNPGFLPSRYQGTLVDPAKGIKHASLPADVSKAQRKQELEAIQAMNRSFYSDIKSNELEARIHSYETAFRTQTSAPELFETGKETAETENLYGCNKGPTGEVGRACLPVCATNGATRCSLHPDSRWRMGRARQLERQP